MSSSADSRDLTSIPAKSRRHSPGRPQGTSTTPRRRQDSSVDRCARSPFNTGLQWNLGNSNPLPGQATAMTLEQCPCSEQFNPPLLSSSAEQRGLPPLTASSSPRGQRWQQFAFGGPPEPIYPASSSTMNACWAPAALNAPAYYPRASPSSPYASVTGGETLSSMSSRAQARPYHDEQLLRLQPRPTTPDGCRVPTVPTFSAPHFSTPPVPCTAPEEPAMKTRKRKRANAAQLRLLNETYDRTAFPSTPERQALAEALDMSPRSVQIWFQNKRRSMRQAYRLSSVTSVSSNLPSSGG